MLSLGCLAKDDSNPEYNPTAKYSNADKADLPYDGGSVSRRSPKLTKRLKSENTSRRVWSDRFESELADGVVASGGEERAARMLSPAAEPGMRDTRLEPGLVMLATRPGSMSSEERKDVLSSSGFVLVIVRKASRRSF